MRGGGRCQVQRSGSRRGVRVPRAVQASRLILAAKAAAAASIAWFLAPYVPFASDEYSYYAPLGVLVTMYSTVAASARAGLQSLAGLGIGIALGLGGLGLVLAGVPAVVAIAVVIGVGILIGGVAALGVGRDWVAMAALFVLLLGGRAAEEFSLSYLLTMAFGVLVGVVTNLLIAPPLFLQRASEELTTLRESVCGVLRDVAAVLEDDADDGLAASRDVLAEMLTTVAEEVRVAEESSRGNPRSRRRSADRDMNLRRMEALERTTRATVDLMDILARSGDEDVAPAGTRKALAGAIRASADLVASPVGDTEAAAKLAAAVSEMDRAVDELDDRSLESTPAPYSRAYAYAALVCVGRIVEASRQFVSVPEG